MPSSQLLEGWRIICGVELCLPLTAFCVPRCLFPPLATSCLLFMSSPGIPAGLLRPREGKQSEVNCMFVFPTLTARARCRQCREITKPGGGSTVQMSSSLPSAPSCLLSLSCRYVHMCTYMCVHAVLLHQVLCKAKLFSKVAKLDS